MIVATSNGRGMPLPFMEKKIRREKKKKAIDKTVGEKNIFSHRVRNLGVCLDRIFPWITMLTFSVDLSSWNYIQSDILCGICPLR